MEKKKAPVKATASKAVGPAKNPALLALRKRADALMKKWENPVVKNAQDFESVALITKDFSSLRKELKALVDPEIKAAKADYDAKRNAFKEVDSILERGEESLRLALETYNEKQRKAAEVKVEKALASGNDEKAAAIAARPITPAIEGLSFTERWHAEVTDFSALLTAVLDGKVSQEALLPNMVFLNGEARQRKGECSIPGVKAVSESSSTIRG